MPEKVKFLEVDKPNRNNRVYSLDVIKESIKDFENKKVRIYDSLIKFPNSKTIGYASNIAIENGFLCGDVEIIEEEALLYLGRTVNIRPIGHGTIGDDGTVQNDYKILGFVIVLNPNEKN